MNFFKATWTRLINTGIDVSVSFEEKKITQLLNIFSVIGLPIAFGFAIHNVACGFYGLATINTTVGTGSILILIIHKNRQLLAARLVVATLGMLVFSVAALLYNNGGEYFLLLNIVATILLFKNRYYVVGVSIVNALLFTAIKVLHIYRPIESQVPYWRIVFNISWMLLLVIIALYYYKVEQNNYQRVIERSNRQLKKQKKKLLEQKETLQLQKDQLQTLNETKEKLFSIIAHDLRAPIGSLKSSLSLFTHDILTRDEMSHITRQLTMQVDNLYQTMDTLLHWSHSQLNGMQSNRVVLALKPLIDKCIALLMENALHKQLEFEVNVDEGLRIFADANQVKVIVRNLLSNAIKFSHPNSTIQITCTPHGDEAKLQIRDYGVGMDPLQVAQLFKYKVQSSRGTGNETGTGLGLLLCKEFVHTNNGEIGVTSTPGKGTTFTVSIPLAA